MTGPDRIVPLYSSSSGNSTLIKSRGTYILVDCGMSCKMMTKALVACGVYPEDVSAVFLTHRHSDHVNGVPVFSRKYHTPIYGTRATLAVLDGLASPVTEIEENDIVQLENGPEVRAFPTPHDVNGSVCYRIFNHDTGNSIAVMTDLGRMNDGMKGFARSSDVILLESKYDPYMLEHGEYPWPLKKRISGGHGHISNPESAECAEFFINNGTKKFILGHLSPHNNTPDIARETFTTLLADRGLVEGIDYEVKIAKKDMPSEGYVL